LESRLNKNISVDDIYHEKFFKTQEDDNEEEMIEDDDKESRFAVSFDFWYKNTKCIKSYFHIDYLLCSDIVSKSAIDSNKPEREMEFVESFLSADGVVKKQFIGHPLVASFVFMKWELIRWIFIWSFIFNVMKKCLWL
jgi:hypothetical protein